MVILFLLLVGFKTGASASSIGEYQIKAAFLLNFIKFIDWPPEAFPNTDTPIIIGILGSNPFGDAMEPLRQKRVKGRSFEIKKFMNVNTSDICHVLFISYSEKNELEDVIEQLKGRNVLTIGETTDFARMGGVINFIKVNNKIRFEINLAAAKQANLVISSKMLKLAKIVGEINH